MVQIPEQSQCTGHLPFAILLKAKTEGDGEWRADHRDDDDPVIVLNIGSHLAVHFVLNFPFHTGVATAGERATDFDSIHRRHQPSGPFRVEVSVAFQSPGDFAAQRKHRFGRLSFERIADGIVADRSDTFRQHSIATLGLDLEQARNLHGGTQEDRVEYLLPGVLRKLPPLRQGFHQSREAKHLVQISLEPVPDQTGRPPFFFSLRNRFRLTPQMVAAAASKRRRISIFSRTFSASSAGMLRAFGLPSISTEIWYWEWRRLPSAQ